MPRDVSDPSAFVQMRPFAPNMPQTFRDAIHELHAVDASTALTDVAVCAALQCVTCCVLLWLEGPPGGEVPAPLSVHACQSCGVLGTALQRCSGCAGVWYCSRCVRVRIVSLCACWCSVLDEAVFGRPTARTTMSSEC